MVHTAPAYGEADFFALQKAGISALVDPIDLEARFTDEFPEVEGLHVKAADPILIALLKENQVTFAEMLKLMKTKAIKVEVTNAGEIAEANAKANDDKE